MAPPQLAPARSGAGDGGIIPDGPQSAHIIDARVRAEQRPIRRDHQAAQEHRLARRRARRRRGDLTELLGRMGLQAHDHDRAADLLRRTQVAVREIEGLVTGAGASGLRR